MTFHELLYVEIWSKRTSRKIFIVVGVIAIAFVLLYQVDASWTSPRERRAAKEALSQLDALQVLADTNSDAYVATHQAARQKVDVATHSWLTSRDHVVAFTLSMYLMSIENENTGRITDQTIRAKWANSSDPRIQELLVSRSKTPQTWKSIDDFVSRNLHSVLD